MHPIRKSSTPQPESLQKRQSSQIRHKIVLPQRASGTAGGDKQGLLSQKFSDRPGQIDLLLLKLAGKTLPSAHKGLSSLRGMLSLLNNNPPVPGSVDSLLAVKYLESWIRKYGQDFPAKIMREIRQTAQLLQYENREIQALREDSGFLYTVDGSSAEEKGRPSWSLSVNRDRNGAGAEPGENTSYCVLNFDSSVLGPLKAVLHYDGKRSRIGFHCSKWQTRHLLRHAFTRFRNRLFRSGFQSCELRVGRYKSNKLNSPTRRKPVRRIGLWG
jgi:hypothetical protein